MIKIAILLGLIRLLTATGKPFLCSGIYAITVLILGIMVGHQFPGLLTTTAIGFMLASIYFWLLDRFDGNKLIWWIVAVLGIALGFV